MNFLSHETLERLGYAAKQIERAEEEISAATEAPDPVAQRRHLVRAANAFRRAGELLDDYGRLTE